MPSLDLPLPSPHPLTQGEPSSKRARAIPPADPRRQGVGQPQQVTTELWEGLAELENVEFQLLQRKKEDLQRKVH